MTETQTNFVNKFGKYTKHLEKNKLDYNNLMRRMQNDKDFDKMINAMTMARIKGKSAFEKHNIKF